MGAYSSLDINGYSVVMSYGGTVDYLMSIFSEKNKIIKLDEDYDGEVYTVFYEMQMQEFSDCLKIMGFTYESAKRDFYLVQEETDDYYIYNGQEFLVRDISFDDFIEHLSLIINKGVHFVDSSVNEKYHKILSYMLDYNNNYYILGIPVSDVRYLIQLIIYVLEERSGQVRYDVSDLINQGYCDLNFEFASKSKSNMVDTYIDRGKTIILTEGKTDADVLRSALEIMFPHLVEYYSFIDFDSVKLPGSTSEMVKIVKTFIASGINNRIIAIFDNDTAGDEALISLKNLNMPNNIRTIKYPDIDYAKHYPTIGPQGNIDMDINGLACSIELYFGVDVLIENDKFIPIQWTGYNTKLKRYQGEVLYKANLKKKFFKLINEIKETNKESLFPELRKILISIFNTFDSFDT